MAKKRAEHSFLMLLSCLPDLVEERVRLLLVAAAAAAALALHILRSSADCGFWPSPSHNHDLFRDVQQFADNFHFSVFVVFTCGEGEPNLPKLHAAGFFLFYLNSVPSVYRVLQK